jgi:hypothetical protein
MTGMRGVFLTLMTAAVAAAGCGRQASDQPSTSANTNRSEKVHSSGTTAPSNHSTAPTHVRSQTTATPSPQKIPALEKAYSETADAKQRRAIAYKLADIGNVGSVQALGRLFQKETDPDLKDDLLSALWVIDGSDKEKVAVYALAVRSNQPDEVRKEAIDGLSDIEDAAALPVLQALLTDPSQEIRDAAQEAIDSVNNALATP